jgi:hypothetical protein
MALSGSFSAMIQILSMILVPVTFWFANNSAKLLHSGILIFF